MKKAFTMMELIFVLIVIGILAALMLPEMKSSKLREAAIQVISHIRYTQHLAMVDDKFGINDANWYKKRWQIIFADYTLSGTPTRVAYSIFSDNASSATGKPDIREIARNPSDIDKVLSGGHSNIDNVSDQKFLTNKLNLTKNYGIISYDLDDLVPATNGCNNSRIAFDYLGRPIKGDISGNGTAYESDNLIQRACFVILSTSNDSIIIKIHPETGYACILKENSVNSECI